MRPLRAWLLRLRGVFRANRDGRFAEEIGAHLEMHVRDLIESGLSPDESAATGHHEAGRRGINPAGTCDDHQ